MSRTNGVPEDDNHNAQKNALYETYKMVKEYLLGLPQPFGEKLSQHASHTAHEDVSPPGSKSSSESGAVESSSGSNSPENSQEPANFGVVVPNSVYRSSYPQADDFPYLESLGLKTILTLVPEEIVPEYRNFMDNNGIQHFQVHIPANKPVIRINASDMIRVLEIVLDRRNHPILIHCNKGKHRTGCVVGCFRRCVGADSETIFKEYHKYADRKARVLDEAFIEQFDENIVLAMARRYNWVAPIHPPSPVPTVNSSLAVDSRCI